MPMVKRRSDYGAASTKQSPTMPEEETPVGNKNARPNQLLRVRPWLWFKESSRGSPKGHGTPRK